MSCSIEFQFNVMTDNRADDGQAGPDEAAPEGAVCFFLSRCGLVENVLLQFARQLL